MESGFDLQLLSAYVDEALDLPQQLEMQARVERDARLRARVQNLRQLREAIRGHACRHGVPEELLLRLRESTEVGSRAGVRLPSTRIDWRRWFAWQPMALALGVAAMAGLGVELTLWEA